MKLRNHQKGLAHQGAILLAVLLLIIGSIGYYVFNANQKKNNKTLTIKNTATKKEAQKSNKQIPKAQKYLVIKEWGVKFALSDSAANAYYTVRPTDENGYNYVEIFDSSIDVLKNSDGEVCKDTTYPLFVIGQYPANFANNDPASGPLKTIKINNKEYSGQAAGQSYPKCYELKNGQEDAKVLVSYDAEKKRWLNHLRA